MKFCTAPLQCKAHAVKKLFVALIVACAFAGNAYAGFKEGATAYNAKNYSLALKEIFPLAKAGDPQAQHLLGLMYYMGRGVTIDYRAALAWHRKAAEQGQADAQYVVGAMYYTGNSVAADPAQAVTWFRRAATKGHAPAQHALALMYRYHAGGLPEDKVLAYLLLNLAATGGNANASQQRAEIARRMTQAQIDEAQALTRAWHPGQPLPTSSRTGEPGE